MHCITCKEVKRERIGLYRIGVEYRASFFQEHGLLVLMVVCG